MVEVVVGGEEMGSGVMCWAWIWRRGKHSSVMGARQGLDVGEGGEMGERGM